MTLFFVLTLLLACDSGSDSGSTDDECDEPEVHDLAEPCAEFASTADCPLAGGQHWETITEEECGNTLEECGPLCFWQLDVQADGTWAWQGSDYGDVGTWSCDSGTLVADDGSREVTWSFDADSCTLRWDGGFDYVLLSADGA